MNRKNDSPLDRCPDNSSLEKYKKLLSRYDALSQKYENEKNESEHLIELLSKEMSEANACRAAVLAMQNSNSWKITAPIRSFSGFAKRTFFSLKNMKTKTDKPIQQKDREIVDSEDFKDYQSWLNLYDNLDNLARDQILKDIDTFAFKPKISLLMPVYDPPIGFLEHAIMSVLGQIYPNWELCIADDASTDNAVRSLLLSYAAKDQRIKLTLRPENGHISAASNSALDLVTGDYVALLDHDDLITPHALYHVAKVIVRDPEVMLIYSDEDKVDVDGQRHDPYFKPDWNPDLIYSHNLFSHLGVYRYSLIKDVGGFRIGFEGSQDYDLLLRCLEKINLSQIFHIPYVLYHWRVHANSTAMVDSDAKPYAMIAGERAINEHLLRQGIKGHVELIGFGYRQHYDLPHSRPLVSIIIPTRNSISVVQNCIDSIRRLTTYKPYEILLIDNGSDEPDSLKGWEDLAATGIHVLKFDGDFNYSAINNYAVSHARGELIALVNNDIEVLKANWLEIMVGYALQPNVGAVGARLLFPDSSVQHAGVVMGLGGVAGHAHYRFPDKATGYFGRLALTSTFSAVSAACLVVRRDLYLQVGGLDEINLPVAFNDVDFCLKLNDSGFRTTYAADAVLLHHESLTRGSDSDSKNRIRFTKEASWMRRKWGHIIKNDPCYSPNLTLDCANFSLAWPPRLESYLHGDGEI